MKRILPFSLVVCGSILAYACSSSDSGTPPTIPTAEGGSSGSSGTSGTSGSSGSSGDAAVDAPVILDEPCASEAECTRPKTSCVLTAAGAGTCKATCTPFGSDCAAGSTCTAHAPETAGVTQISKAAFCRTIGGTALGASCLDDPGACGTNAECLFFPDKGEGVPQSRCHSLCDPTHACGGGQGNCITKTGEAFGFCDGG